MSAADHLSALVATKAALKAAIAERGVDMPADTPFSYYAQYVSQIGGGLKTTLRREEDGSVTILSLAPTWTPILTRQPDGSILVSE